MWVPYCPGHWGHCSDMSVLVKMPFQGSGYVSSSKTGRPLWGHSDPLHEDLEFGHPSSAYGHQPTWDHDYFLFILFPLFSLLLIKECLLHYYFFLPKSYSGRAKPQKTETDMLQFLTIFLFTFTLLEITATGIIKSILHLDLGRSNLGEQSRFFIVLSWPGESVYCCLTCSLKDLIQRFFFFFNIV